jgi:hypothetical protein
VVGSGNTLHSVSGANVTFDPPGTTVAGAQFMTPGIHDLATQRIITLKSNNYSGNRSADYLVPTMNIKAKYSNVAINTAGRVIFSNRYDNEVDMPSVSKHVGLITYLRNEGSTGQLMFANADSRHRLYNANLDLIPAQNSFFSLGTAAVNFKEMHLGANARILGNVEINKGLAVGVDDFVIKYQNPTQQMKIGIGTANPEFEVDIRSNVRIDGNLTVTGNTQMVSTSHLIINDPVIELGANTTGAPTQDAGVLMNRGSSSNAFVGYDESGDQFITAFTTDPSTVTTINIGSYAPIQTGPLSTNYSANLAGNTSISRSLAVGYTGGRVPQANLDVKGNVYVGGDALIADNSYLYFGDGKDLRVGHISNDSYIQDIGTGTLNIEGSSIAIRNVGGTEAMASFTPDGSVALNYDNVKKFETSSSGTITYGLGANIAGNVSVVKGLAVGYTDGRVPQANLDVKGNVYIDGNTHVRDQQILSFGTSKDLQIYHDGANSYFKDQGTGNITFLGNQVNFVNAAGNETLMQVNQNSDVQLFYDNVKKLETTGTGIAISGLGANVAGNVSVTRSLAVGYTDGRVPQANLDVKGNTFISGKITGTMAPTFMGANVTGNVSVTRSLAVGWTDGRVPQANLEVIGNANVGILTATSLRINGSPVSTTSTFTGLTDTPSSYSGQAGKLTAVNSSANALEFVDDNAVVMAIALG